MNERAKQKLARERYGELPDELPGELPGELPDELDDELPDELDDSARMPFVEHLRELRDRLRNSVLALSVFFFVAYAFKEDLFIFIVKPLLPVLARLQAEGKPVGDGALYFNSAIEPFWTYFSLALWAAVFLASPFIFYQVWKFISPGLYKNERRYGIGFALASAVCFIGGATFCYVLVLPEVLNFLIGFATADMAAQSKLIGEVAPGVELKLVPLLTMQQYLSFARKLLIGFGVVFELPLVIFFLSLVGMVTHRSLWRFNRWWIVISFILAAMLTPPDLASQLLMAAPLVVLYNLSIIIAFIITRRREKREAALTPE